MEVKLFKLLNLNSLSYTKIIYQVPFTIERMFYKFCTTLFGIDFNMHVQRCLHKLFHQKNEAVAINASEF